MKKNNYILCSFILQLGIVSGLVASEKSDRDSDYFPELEMPSPPAPVSAVATSTGGNIDYSLGDSLEMPPSLSSVLQEDDSNVDFTHTSEQDFLGNRSVFHEADLQRSADLFNRYLEQSERKKLSILNAEGIARIGIQDLEKQNRKDILSSIDQEEDFAAMFTPRSPEKKLPKLELFLHEKTDGAEKVIQELKKVLENTVTYADECIHQLQGIIKEITSFDVSKSFIDNKIPYGKGSSRLHQAQSDVKKTERIMTEKIEKVKAIQELLHQTVLRELNTMFDLQDWSDIDQEDQ